MKYFDQKTILLTGANGGFGQEIVRQLNKTSAKLILSDIGDSFDADAPANAAYIQADLSKVEGCEHLVKLAGDIDVLVNNAGIVTIGQFVDVPAEKWQQLMEVNLMAPVRLTSLLLPAMRSKKSGHIVNISAISGYMATPSITPYCTSKFAMRGFGQALRGEVAAHGIFVSNIYPAFTRTPILNFKENRFGYAKEVNIPDFLIDELDEVTANLLKAIANREQEIFPSFKAKALALARQWAPDVSQFLSDHFVHLTE